MLNMDKWLYYFKDLESPEIFLRWTYLWTISATLQRRVYWGDEGMPLFGNGYIVFVADPGIGKSLAARQAGDKILRTFNIATPKAIDNCDGMPVLIPQISFSADATSYQSLIQQLGASTRSFSQTYVDKDGIERKKPAAHNSMAMLLSEEMTTMFRRDTEDMAAALNHWWDAQDFEYKIIGREGGDKIKNVCVSLLGCTTPDNMRRLMSSGILDGGFTARTIFLYADKSRHLKAEFEFPEEQKQAFREVREHVKQVLALAGPCRFSPEAKKWFYDFYESGKLQGEVCNKDERLKHYRGRLKVHAIKTSMWLHFSESTSMTIELDTVKKAITYLREAEVHMHKALASRAKNPLHDLALEILEFIKEQKPTKIRINIAFNSSAPTKDIDAAMEFLQISNMIEPLIGNGKTTYRVKE